MTNTEALTQAAVTATHSALNYAWGRADGGESNRITDVSAYAEAWSYIRRLESDGEVIGRPSIQMAYDEFRDQASIRVTCKGGVHRRVLVDACGGYLAV